MYVVKTKGTDQLLCYREADLRPVYSYAFCIVSTHFGVQITLYESL